MRTLYLYGPPASGKSWWANKIAVETGLAAVDLDAEIVRRAGRSIPDIFATDGEKAFRDMESATLMSVDASIVALGGGTLLRDENREFAEENGFVAVIDADEEEIARRIEAAKGTRPLGNRLAERRPHYASFRHHVAQGDEILMPGLLRGRVTPPVSKSHLHRLLIAWFLSGKRVEDFDVPENPGADIEATLRCLGALESANRGGEATLDCGESGSTLRFLAPVAASLGVKADFVRRGRLADRPMMEYDGLKPGVHELRGDVSSQFVTGLLFALPTLDGDSMIRFTTPLQSRGYVDMTLDVVRGFGIVVYETGTGFAIPGGQRFTAAGSLSPERDWSGAAFWYAANALGSHVEIEGLSEKSSQPDRVVAELIGQIKSGGTIDVSGCPDNYPALAVVAHSLGTGAKFTGTERLRLKESDRLAAMEDVFASPNDIDARNDHRIAMAAAILATAADAPTIIHSPGCVRKSYPSFWSDFHRLQGNNKCMKNA